MGVFEREFWSNTPGELALVWDFKGEGNKAAMAVKKEGPATATPASSKTFGGTSSTYHLPKSPFVKDH